MKPKVKDYIRDCYPIDQWIEEGFKAGVAQTLDYFSRHWMGCTKGMMLYEIPEKDRDLLGNGIIPEEAQ